MRPSLSVLSDASKVTSDLVSGALGAKVNDGTGVPFGGRMMPGGTSRIDTERVMAFAKSVPPGVARIWTTVWVSTGSAGASGAV